MDESFKNKLNDTETGVSRIEKVPQSFINDSNSLIKDIDEEEKEDEYDDDDDPGFNIHEAGEHNFIEKCKEIAEAYGYPRATVKPADELDRKFEKERLKKQQEERDKEDETVDKKKKSKKPDADKLALKRALGQIEDQESEPESDESIPTNLPKWVRFVP